MATYTIEMAVRHRAADLYAALRDYERFPGWAEDVAAVAVEGDTSRWAVRFRGGLIRWTQHDRAEEAADTFRIGFEQTEGDFAAFSGAWTIEPTSTGSLVTYRADAGTSVANLARAIEPLVGRVLLRSAVAVVAGAAAGPVEVLAGGRLLDDQSFAPA
ncbi:SRPBCC family protein [Spirillospora sp. NPDC047279]|uniref:type II toxin-antitoxin system RatA family toxin n=1 Tax=Spirillospora sp. NPDC047279 TaxID=3155478 RepID=UPI00341009CD